jgi:predicted NBD/HSP70 family sugar kinase
MINNTKDLTKQAPTAPSKRTGGYAILTRMTDKARADIAGKIGDYHTDCPLDHMLLDWKNVEYAGVRKALEAGATDEAIVAHLNTHGTPKTPEEISTWSDDIEKATMHGDPHAGEWFDGECQKLGLDPAKTTTFEFLEADDRASYGK